MDQIKETYEFSWRGITVRVSFCPDWSKAYREVYGHPMAHLEVKTGNREPLPITDTGYYSLFIPLPQIEEEGGAVAFVQAWLDHEAQNPAWIAKEEAAKQMSLF